MIRKVHVENRNTTLLTALLRKSEFIGTVIYTDDWCVIATTEPTAKMALI